MYRQKVAALRQALTKDEEARHEAAEISRSLIDEIRLVPDQGNLALLLRGDLASRIRSKNPRRDEAAGVQVTLVAGERFTTWHNMPVQPCRLSFGTSDVPTRLTWILHANSTGAPLFLPDEPCEITLRADGRFDGAPPGD